MPSWSVVVDYEADHEALAAIARRHGLTADNVRPIPAGVANHAFHLGDDLVLRIPRTTQFLADLVKEAAVIPAAVRVGVRTPDIVAFDDTCSEVNVPYMVLTRAPGLDLARLALSTTETEHVFHQVGRQLAKLHRLSAHLPPDPPPAFRPCSTATGKNPARRCQRARDHGKHACSGST